MKEACGSVIWFRCICTQYGRVRTGELRKVFGVLDGFASGRSLMVSSPANGMNCYALYLDASMDNDMLFKTPFPC